MQRQDHSRQQRKGDCDISCSQCDIYIDIVHQNILYQRQGVSVDLILSVYRKSSAPGNQAGQDKAQMAFKLYDRDKDGYITKAEMVKLSKNLTKDQVEKVCPSRETLKCFKENLFRHFLNSILMGTDDCHMMNSRK